MSGTARPMEAFEDLAELNRQVARAVKVLGAVRDQDVRVGVSETEEVWREDKAVLYRFKPLNEKLQPVPLLVVYALVNRPYMVDLQADRSLARNLLELGVDLYLIDWGYPTAADRWLTLDDYINGYIDDCVDVLRRRHNVDKVNVLGICQGGTFSLCYSALHPDKVANLITMVAPVDFHAGDGLLNRWALDMDIDTMVDALGNVPGEFMNFGFLMLRPFQMNVAKYVDLLDLVDDEDRVMNFLRMEKWIFDSPDQAGEAYRQFMKDFYQGNKLVNGTLEIGGRPVRLGDVTMPVLNIYAEQDHLVPPPCSIALKDHVGTEDYTARSFPVGHIGMYVSGKVQRTLPPAIADWLGDHTAAS
jgi:polyhydroxyalkanoate synthase